MGEGAALTAEALAPPDQAPGGYNFFLVRSGPGAQPEALSSRLAAAAADAGCPPVETCGRLPETLRPVDIRGYAAVRSTPIVLSGLMAVLAACTVGHAPGHLGPVVRRRWWKRRVERNCQSDEPRGDGIGDRAFPVDTVVYLEGVVFRPGVASEELQQVERPAGSLLAVLEKPEGELVPPPAHRRIGAVLLQPELREAVGDVVPVIAGIVGTAALQAASEAYSGRVADVPRRL